MGRKNKYWYFFCLKIWILVWRSHTKIMELFSEIFVGTLSMWNQIQDHIPYQNNMELINMKIFSSWYRNLHCGDRMVYGDLTYARKMIYLYWTRALFTNMGVVKSWSYIFILVWLHLYIEVALCTLHKMSFYRGYLQKPWSIMVVHFCSRELVCFPRVSFVFRELFLVSASYFWFPRVNFGFCELVFVYRELFFISASYFSFPRVSLLTRGNEK